ncbi:Uma2 family endonuclease [Roseofilum capinflatum]|uniref:Uma2 family endonuclease n=1 Tax=Roseofilum capinflatum BLCC-M114 TaxID=3022440 RepID=A0ABT7BA89_9CYAN|nr:Uma2 family endonuclease [Roseofilum capinflatum]MDJ1175208.1 Uma2 family endonuclease [Roseofilum capinflatum BLCC-M114]
MVALSESYFISPEEYLDMEENNKIRHEYIDGELYAMTGGTDRHNIIGGNLYMLIRNHLRGTDCQVYFNDVKARIEKRNRFYYPDLMVTCDPRDRETPVHKGFPKLIIEVLSPGTEAFDRGDKFNDYDTLETLEEYVLVNTNKQRVDIFRRNGQSGWYFQAYTPDGETFPLQSLGLTVSFSDLYESIENE